MRCLHHSRNILSGTKGKAMPQPMFVYIMIWSTGMISERPTDGNTSSVPINMLGQLEGDPFGGGQRSRITHGLSVHWGISSEEVKEVW